MAKKVLIVGGLGGGNGYLDDIYDDYHFKDDSIKKLRKTDITINNDLGANAKIFDNFSFIEDYNLKFDTVFFEYVPAVIPEYIDISYRILLPRGKLIIGTGRSWYEEIITKIAPDLRKKWVLFPHNKRGLFRFIKI
jgi:hypothetical protein